MSADYDLIAALAAQLDDDEAAARIAADRTGFLEWQHATSIDGRDVIRMGDDETFGAHAALAAHIARHDPGRKLREITAKRAVLAEHLPIETDYGLTCKRCVSWQDDEGQHEFGIAIPDSWPCLSVAAIAASDEHTLALAADVLTAGRAITEAEFLAMLPYRMQAIADQLSRLLPDGMRLEWAPRSPE